MYFKALLGLLITIALVGVAASGLAQSAPGLEDPELSFGEVETGGGLFSFLIPDPLEKVWGTVFQMAKALGGIMTFGVDGMPAAFSVMFVIIGIAVPIIIWKIVTPGQG